MTEIQRAISITQTLTAIVVVWPALATGAPSRQSSAIATPDQIALDRTAVDILAMPKIQAEKKTLRQLYLDDAQGATQDGRARLDNAVTTTMFAAIINVVDDDAYRPKIMWGVAAPHEWNGLKVSGSGFGINNPDNVYRHTPINGDLRYEITGRLPHNGPTQESFTLYRSPPGSAKSDTQAAREGSPILGALTLKDLVAAPDGTFTITIDHDRANGRPNHIQSGDNPDEVLIIRDTLGDWATQNPVHLHVVRVGGPALGPVRTEAEIADLAIDRMRIMAPFWIKYDNDYIFSKPVNVIETPHKRDAGWGVGAMGRFALDQDEALLVTVDPLGAKYLGFQISDVWGIAPDYIHHSSSLNNHQAQPEPDGSYNYVISPKDPGIHNWIDTVGMRSGIFLIRWQELADKTVSAEHAIRAVRVVKLRDLKSAMGGGFTPVSAEERHRLLSERATSYERRLSGD